MNRSRAHYDLGEARCDALRGSFEISRRASGSLVNHGYLDVREVVGGVFEAMGEEHFYKSDELKNLPGTYADIYKGVPWDGEEWYVKFFRREDGSEVITIWSLKHDGWQ